MECVFVAKSLFVTVFEWYLVRAVDDRRVVDCGHSSRALGTALAATDPKRWVDRSDLCQAFAEAAVGVVRETERQFVDVSAFARTGCDVTAPHEYRITCSSSEQLIENWFSLIFLLPNRLTRLSSHSVCVSTLVIHYKSVTQKILTIERNGVTVERQFQLMGLVLECYRISSIQVVVCEDVARQLVRLWARVALDLGQTRLAVALVETELGYVWCDAGRQNWDINWTKVSSSIRFIRIGFFKFFLSLAFNLIRVQESLNYTTIYILWKY